MVSAVFASWDCNSGGNDIGLAVLNKLSMRANDVVLKVHFCHNQLMAFVIFFLETFRKLCNARSNLSLKASALQFPQLALKIQNQITQDVIIYAARFVEFGLACKEHLRLDGCFQPLKCGFNQAFDPSATIVDKQNVCGRSDSFN